MTLDVASQRFEKKWGWSRVLGLRVSGGKDRYAGMDVLGSEQDASKGIAEPELELALHEF